ncbi:MAG: two-component system LytT family sensor kinase [Dokdonia sp.]|jgi:two-component system LytT family sensor kinase
MKALKRIIFQILFWSGVWVIMTLGHKDILNFMEQNWMIYILQIALISIVTVSLVPNFLNKKKQTPFVVLGLCIVIVCAFLSYQFSADGPFKNTPKESPQNFQKERPLDRPDGLRPGPPPEGFEKDTQDRFDRPPPPRNQQQKPPPNPRRNLTQLGKTLNSPFLINFLLLCITFILTTAIEVFLFAKKKEAALILSKTETLETELKLLKSQINPHFLFNALNNIYALSAIDAGKTQESISYLSNMLRYVLYECERPFVTLQKEVDYIEDYIKLFSLKSSKTYPIETHFTMADTSIVIAPMLLIPFVENAFKHSTIESIKDTFIKIHIDANQDTITFKIENTIAPNNTKKDDVGGIGLENVKKRLAILYPENHTLHVSEEMNIFHVELTLKTNA